MKLRVIGLAALGCAGALGFGVLANACLDMILPAAARVTVAAPAEAEPASEQAANSDLIGTTDIRPVKVRTVPIAVSQPESLMVQAPVAAPRPAAQRAAPAEAAKPVVRQANVVPVKPARAARVEEPDILSPGQIERIRTALALTPEQDAFWPPVAAELLAIARQQPKGALSGKTQKLALDQDAVQRLYWAAAPLITRLTEEQKRKARELALVMGLQQVAEAL